MSPSEFEELRRLRAENAELKVEKEILREATAYVARETIRSAASGSSPSTEVVNADSDTCHGVVIAANTAARSSPTAAITTPRLNGQERELS